MKKDIKNTIKSMSIKELMTKLQELDTERLKLETKCYAAGGSVRIYPKEKQTHPFGNIRRIKKDIARIKTWLHIKLKANPN